MAEELKACGKNGYGETFWKLCVPDEHCSPGLEVGISAGERGVTIGGRLIKWTELDTARAQPTSQGGEAVAWLTSDKRHLVFSGVLDQSQYLEQGMAPLYTHPADQVAEGVVVPLIKAAIKYIDSQVFYKFGEPVTKADREGRRIADELRQLLAKSEGVKE